MKNSDIKDRILQILKEEELTSSKFAIKLGVQPSSISHIISGRNKPSLDFLQKVLKNFTSINPLWLIMGKGDMFVKKMNIQTQINFDAGEERKKNEAPLLPDTRKSQALQDAPKIASNLSDKSKKIRKIIVFYTDNTFEEFDKSK